MIISSRSPRIFSATSHNPSNYQPSRLIIGQVYYHAPVSPTLLYFNPSTFLASPRVERDPPVRRPPQAGPRPAAARTLVWLHHGLSGSKAFAASRKSCTHKAPTGNHDHLPACLPRSSSRPPASGLSSALTCVSATSLTSTHAWPGASNGPNPMNVSIHDRIEPGLRARGLRMTGAPRRRRAPWSRGGRRCTAGLSAVVSQFTSALLLLGEVPQGLSRPCFFDAENLSWGLGGAAERRHPRFGPRRSSPLRRG